MTSFIVARALSVSTLHRVPLAIAARYETMREQLNEQLREAERVPDEAVTVQVGIDGVMVPQDGEDAKPRGRKTDAPKAPRHETRYGPVNLDGPASNDGAEGRAWHEASVGTLAYYDAAGKHLRTVYMARMPEAKMATLAQELEAELNHAVAQRPDLNVALASDGDAHQWQILEGIGARIRPRVLGRIVFLLDFYHAAEHLGSAAGTVYGTTSKRRLVASAEWRETLKGPPNGSSLHRAGERGRTRA
jgi:hypothetical protein